MDMTTTYMGIELANPIVVSPCPLGGDLDTIRRLEDAGAAAVVLPSLFQEQVEHEANELDYFMHYGADRFAESLSYYPEPANYALPGDEYAAHLARACEAVDIPVMGSLNGMSVGGWTDYALQMQQAGASAIELNVYFLPTNPAVGGTVVEDAYAEILAAVRDAVTLPVAVKMSPFFTAPAGMATRLAGLGANGLVLFNRFYQPDIDIDALAVVPRLSLSTSADSLLPLRWIAIMHGRLAVSLAATSGIHSAADVARMILAGADVTMMCSALLAGGPGRVRDVLDDLARLMESKGYDSVSRMKGVLSQASCPEPAAFERANYMKTLQSYRASGTRE